MIESKKIEMRNGILLLTGAIIILVILIITYLNGSFNTPLATKSIVLAEGDTLRLDRSGYSVEDYIEWESTDDSVVTVDDEGEVTAKKPGKAIVTLKSSVTYNTKFEIVVKSELESIEATSVTLSKTKVKLEKGQKEVITYKIEPANATNKNITWYSSNEEVATVENGTIKGVSKGEATIVVRTGNNKVAMTEVTVNDSSQVKQTKEVRSIELNRNEVYVYLGEKTNVVATIIPTDSTNKKITWTTDDNSIATINSSGVIEGKKIGTTTITAKSNNNKKATAKVYVIKKTVDVSNVEINQNELQLYLGGTANLVATVTPANADDKTVTWSSSNEKVVSVNSTGKVTANGVGSATITAKTKNGKSATVKVTVEKKIEEPIKVTKLRFKNKESEVTIGSTLQLGVTYEPSNATLGTIEWATSDKSIATVNGSGLVTPIKKGSVTITAKTDNGKEASIKIIVKEKQKQVTNISFKKANEEVTIGDTIQLTITYEPTDAVVGNIEWKTSDKTIATVNNIGVVTPLKSGSVTITAKTDNGKEASINVTVYDRVVNPSSVNINRSSVDLYVGDTVVLVATVVPQNATYKTVEWSTSNKRVATVDSNGKVTAVGKGSVVISATTVNNKTANVTVNVTEKVVEVTGVSLNKTSTTITEGSKEKVTATISPSNATDKTITWSSDNTSIATVNNGEITAVSAGSTTITAKAHNGKKATITVTVKKATVEVTGVSLNKTSTTITVGSKEKVTATISPSNATDKTITWSSDNTSIATVNSGEITAVSAGSTTITAKANNGKKATITVTVKKATVEVTGVSLNKTSTMITVGSKEKVTATVSPSNATDKTVTWSSSNTSVATVNNNGEITGVSEGSATITAKANNGKKATITVTVKKGEIVRVGTFNVGDYVCGSSSISCNSSTYRVGSLVKEKNIGLLGVQEGPPNYNDSYYLNIYGGFKEYGQIILAQANLALSKYSIEERKEIYLDRTCGGEYRGMAKIVVKINGVKISFYATHFGLRDCTEAHFIHAASIIKADPNPTIVVADFNTVPIDLFKQYFTDPSIDSSNTFIIAAHDTSTHNMWKKESYCDSVLINSKGHIFVKGSETFDAYGTYSDHNLVIADLEIVP